jgi:hypothetical protein
MRLDPRIKEALAHAIIELLAPLDPETRVDVFVDVEQVYCVECGRSADDPECSKNASQDEGQ